MPCFPMFYASFYSRLTLRIHAHMMLLAMPCLDLCVPYVYSHAIWLYPCLHMLVCLDSCSSTSMC